MKNFYITILLIFCFCTVAAAQGNGRGSSSNATNIRILSKTEPPYTDMARKNNEQGFVTLRVTFLASGEIGAITVVSALAYGLTEQAIAAAKKIKFEPAKRNGQPISMSKTVIFSFVIYARENDDDIKTKAVILEQPKPEYPLGENFATMRGTVKLRITLTSFGKVMIQTVRSDLPQEFKDKAREAAVKIKYEPALYKNNSKASVDREIEYEFKPEN